MKFGEPSLSLVAKPITIAFDYNSSFGKADENLSKN